jgi:hypothetical protein
MESVMRTLGAFVLAVFLCLPAGALTAAALTPLPSMNNPPMLLEAKLVCGKFDGKFTCKRIKKNNGNKATPAPDGNGAGGGGTPDAGAGPNGGGAGGGAGGTETGPAEPAKPDCPEGYKVLNPPSKFGPCEPPGGLPNNAYTQCPPGATGTPPNCACPGQSDYGTQGNKCMHWSGACGTDKPGWNNPNFFCKAVDKIDCTILADGQEKCCCKKYD